MKMKGNFRQLIENNPEILNEKNPRIQVTNVTCEVEQFGVKYNNILNQKNINLLKYNQNLNNDK